MEQGEPRPIRHLNPMTVGVPKRLGVFAQGIGDQLDGGALGLLNIRKLLTDLIAGSGRQRHVEVISWH